MIVVLFACNLLASLMQSLMNVALDYVSAEYHVSLSEANLLVLGYSIVAGIVIVLAALSLHRFGLRKVMLFGLIVSFVGSLLGVLAWDFPSLVAARLIQAVATGLYFPVVNEALLNLSPKNGAGRLLAINSGIIGIGLAVAPIVSGLVITYWGLRVLFAIPAVTAIRPLFHCASHDRRYYAGVREVARRRAERRAHCRGAFRLHDRLERGYAQPAADGGAHDRGNCRVCVVHPPSRTPRPSAFGHASASQQDLCSGRDPHRSSAI